MNTTLVTAHTLLSSALATVTPNASTSTLSQADTTIETNSFHVEATATSADSTPKWIKVDATDERWSSEKDKRFKQLARDEALRDLSAAELAELEVLTRIRRFAKYPRSADEILRHRQQQKLNHDLLSVMSRYVEFYKPANRP